MNVGQADLQEPLLRDAAIPHDGGDQAEGHSDTLYSFAEGRYPTVAKLPRIADYVAPSNNRGARNLFAAPKGESTRVELQIENLSTATTRILLYSWYLCLVVALVLQSLVGLQWEARNVCDANKESVTDLSTWRSPCVTANPYGAGTVQRLGSGSGHQQQLRSHCEVYELAQLHLATLVSWEARQTLDHVPSCAVGSSSTSSHKHSLSILGGWQLGGDHHGANMEEVQACLDQIQSHRSQKNGRGTFDGQLWSNAAMPVDTRLLASLACGQVIQSSARDTQRRIRALDAAGNLGTPTSVHSSMTVLSGGLVEKVTPLPLADSASGRDEDEVVYDLRWVGGTNEFLDRKLNRFINVVVSMGSPFPYITSSDPLWVLYVLRIVVQEIGSNGGGVDDNSDHSSGSGRSDVEFGVRRSGAHPLPGTYAGAAATAPESSDTSGSSESKEMEKVLLMNATLLCLRGRPRCESIVLPEGVAVATNESRFTLTIFGAPQELALASNTSAVGIVFQRAPYTIGTIVWRYVFMAYSLLNLARFLYHRRYSKGIYEHHWIVLLQAALFLYLNPLFAAGIYEPRGRNVYMFFEFHFPTYFAAILVAFVFSLVTSAMSWDTSAVAGVKGLPRRWDTPPPSPSSGAGCGTAGVAGVGDLHVDAVYVAGAHQVPVKSGADSRGSIPSPQDAVPSSCGSLCGPPLWTRIVAFGFVIVVIAIDLSIGFIDNWSWDLSSGTCTTKLCRALRYLLLVSLGLAGLGCIFMVFWLRRNLGKKSYLASRPQQLACLFFMFIFISAFAYFVVQLVLIAVLYPHIVGIVAYQPLVQLSPVMVATFFTNSMTYVFTSTYRSTKVPIRPDDSRWKRVVWPEAWYRWLNGHGGILYIFDNESEERYFNLVQSAHHDDLKKKRRMKQRKQKQKPDPMHGGAYIPTWLASVGLFRFIHGAGGGAHVPERHSRAASISPRPPCEATRLGDIHEAEIPVDAKDKPALFLVQNPSDLSTGLSKNGMESRYNKYFRPFLATQCVSEVQNSSDPREEPVEQPDAQTKWENPIFAKEQAAGVPPEGRLSDTRAPSPRRSFDGDSDRFSILEDRGSSDTLSIDADFVDSCGDDVTDCDSRSTISSVKSSVYKARRGLRRFVKSAGVRFVDLPGALLDHFEEEILDKALGRLLLRDGHRRMPLFNLESAIDCFNMSWEAYAVDRSTGDQAIETGLNVSPIQVPLAIASLVQRLFQCFRWCCCGCCCFDGAPADSMHSEAESTEKSLLPAASERLSPDHSRESGSPSLRLMAAVSAGNGASRRSRSPAALEESTNSSSPSGPPMNTEQYGYRRLHVFEANRVQVVITKMEHARSPQHRNKYPRLVVAFRGTNNLENARHDVSFKRIVWDEVDRKFSWSSAASEAKVHQGFLEIWLSLKNRVLSCVQEELQKEPEVIYSLFVTGHSLGGALAVLCAYSLQKLLRSLEYPISDVTVYTFGQPRIGNRAFQAAYNKAVPRTFRVVNESDVVVSMTMFGGFHVGIEVDIDRNGNYVCKPTYIERSFRPTKGKGFAVVNHLMTSYGASLNAIAERAVCVARCLQPYPQQAPRLSVDEVGDALGHVRSMLYSTSPHMHAPSGKLPGGSLYWGGARVGNLAPEGGIVRGSAGFVDHIPYSNPMSPEAWVQAVAQLSEPSPLGPESHGCHPNSVIQTPLSPDEADLRTPSQRVPREAEQDANGQGDFSVRANEGGGE